MIPNLAPFKLSVAPWNNEVVRIVLCWPGYRLWFRSIAHPESSLGGEWKQIALDKKRKKR